MGFHVGLARTPKEGIGHDTCLRKSLPALAAAETAERATFEGKLEGNPLQASAKNQEKASDFQWSGQNLWERHFGIVTSHSNFKRRLSINSGHIGIVIRDALTAAPTACAIGDTNLRRPSSQSSVAVFNPIVFPGNLNTLLHHLVSKCENLQGRGTICAI